jgi:hypothetical protein
MQSDLIGDQSFESVDIGYSCEDKPPTLTEVKKNKYQFYQFTNSHASGKQGNPGISS